MSKGGMRVGAVALIALLAGQVSAPADAEAGKKRQLRSCGLTLEQARSFGATYVFNVNVKRANCRKGKKVVRGFHKCRRQKPSGGKRGRCTNRVQGFRCKDRRFDRIQGVQFKGKMVCKRRGARVASQYQQSL